MSKVLSWLFVRGEKGGLWCLKCVCVCVCWVVPCVTLRKRTGWSTIFREGISTSAGLHLTHTHRLTHIPMGRWDAHRHPTAPTRTLTQSQLCIEAALTASPSSLPRRCFSSVCPWPWYSPTWHANYFSRLPLLSPHLFHHPHLSPPIE